MPSNKHPEDEEGYYQQWKTNKLISLKYNRAICMLAAGCSVTEVAKHLKITQRTVQQWFTQTEFNESLKFAIGITFKSALAKAATFADRGVEILIEISESPDTPTKNRIDALRLLFDILNKSNNFDVSENHRTFEKTQTINLLAQNSEIRRLAGIEAELESANETLLQRMRRRWRMIFPDLPFPEDDEELRRWYYDPNNDDVH
jgi:hypothetical protein